MKKERSREFEIEQGMGVSEVVEKGKENWKWCNIKNSKNKRIKVNF